VRPTPGFATGPSEAEEAGDAHQALAMRAAGDALVALLDVVEVMETGELVTVH
jgi:hypothetical protein